MTHLPTITTWPPDTRKRVAAAIIDAALPTCTYRFEQRDGAWTVTSSPEPPTGAEGEQWVYPPDDVVLDFLEERLGRALELLKLIYGIEDEPPPLAAPPLAAPPPARRPRKPTLASVAKQANTAAIPVARYEVRPDGTVVVVTGMPAPAQLENPWPLDEFRTKETKQ